VLEQKFFENYAGKYKKRGTISPYINYYYNICPQFGKVGNIGIFGLFMPLKKGK